MPQCHSGAGRLGQFGQAAAIAELVDPVGEGPDFGAVADLIRLIARHAGPVEAGLTRTSSSASASLTWSHAITDRLSAVLSASHVLKTPRGGPPFGRGRHFPQLQPREGPRVSLALTYGLAPSRRRASVKAGVEGVAAAAARPNKGRGTPGSAAGHQPSNVWLQCTIHTGDGELDGGDQAERPHEQPEDEAEAGGDLPEDGEGARRSGREKPNWRMKPSNSSIRAALSRLSWLW